ncbi:MAG: lipoyl(octanoyl) transferase LipB [Cyclobacteriaceae bacterium]|nr:lipoyl(octanoyl) transferase LipB [Cyclobacteriaceae bacterium]
MNLKPNHETEIIDLGLIDYQQALDYQTHLFNDTLAIKSANRDTSEDKQLTTKNYLIFCEHPHVFTLGKSGDEKNLLVKKEELHTINATYYPVNRGGDITYHGPGQIVVYPVIDMENFFTDIHQYMRLLEESVIMTLKHFSIQSGRIPGLTGVWLDIDNNKARKICALGVKTSRWVTLHGLAFNVNSDLKYFDYIVPCGLADKAVTSMQKELRTIQNMNEVKEVLKNNLVSLFGMKALVATSSPKRN